MQQIIVQTDAIIIEGLEIAKVAGRIGWQHCIATTTPKNPWNWKGQIPGETHQVHQVKPVKNQTVWKRTWQWKLLNSSWIWL